MCNEGHGTGTTAAPCTQAGRTRIQWNPKIGIQRVWYIRGIGHYCRRCQKMAMLAERPGLCYNAVHFGSETGTETTKVSHYQFSKHAGEEPLGHKKVQHFSPGAFERTLRLCLCILQIHQDICFARCTISSSQHALYAPVVPRNGCVAPNYMPCFELGGARQLPPHNASC